MTTMTVPLSPIADLQEHNATSSFVNRPIATPEFTEGFLKEDPLTAFAITPHTNLIENYLGLEAYTATVDGQSGDLEYVLTHANLIEQISDISLWPVNTDESRVINDNEQFNSLVNNSQDSSLSKDYNSANGGDEQFNPFADDSLDSSLSSDYDSVNVSLSSTGTVISGTGFRDELIGTPGDDIITGFGGLDELTGGGGQDDFVYTSFMDAVDIITDFEVGVDQIVLTELFQSSDIEVETYDEAIAQGFISFGVVGDYTTVFFGENGHSGARPLIYLEHVDVKALDNASNFVIHDAEVASL